MTGSPPTPPFIGRSLDQGRLVRPSVRPSDGLGRTRRTAGRASFEREVLRTCFLPSFRLTARPRPRRFRILLTAGHNFVRAASNTNRVVAATPYTVPASTRHAIMSNFSLVYQLNDLQSTYTTDEEYYIFVIHPYYLVLGSSSVIVRNIKEN